jgi:uroporphyrinogen-III synthase
VVITRPRERSTALAALVKAAGGRAIVFPTLEIVDAVNRRALNALIDRLDAFDLAIFVSPTAVNRAMSSIRARRTLPRGLTVAAVGAGTARELRNFGIERVLAPAERFDSEALLELTELGAPQGKAVVIFRGEGGRALLGDTLAARGASVEYAECYKRIKPNGDAQSLLKAWARGEIQAVTVTSGEALRNLSDMLGTLGRPWLRKTPLFVPHEHIAVVARELAISTVTVTGAGDEGLVAGMSQYFAAGS